MKLHRRTKDRLVFHLGTRERRLLQDTLRLYPLVPAAHHRLSRNTPDAPTPENQQLLEEALADQRHENRRQVEALLKEPQRFQADDDGFLLTLKTGEVEWLLQVFNDVRVGSWLTLGEPDEDHLPEKLTPESLRYALALEVCGIFQSALLAALGVRQSADWHDDAS